MLALTLVGLPACQSEATTDSSSIEIGSADGNEEPAESGPDTNEAPSVTPAPTAVLIKPSPEAAPNDEASASSDADTTPDLDASTNEANADEAGAEDDSNTESTTDGTASETSTDSSNLISFDPSPGVERLAATPDAPVAELVAGFNGVGFDLLRQQAPGANTVLSPMSIGHTVLMARAAADEPTGAAIDMALALPGGAAAHEAWNAIDTQIEASNVTEIGLDQAPTPTVTIAGRIWPSLSARPDQAWIDRLTEYHGTDLAPIDVDDPEASRQEINGWVDTQTNGLIPELLPSGFIDPSTELVLTDAVYFKAQWKKVFGQTGPVERPFTMLDGSTTPVTMLREFSPLGTHYSGGDLDAAEIPYLGDDYSLLLIIPKVGRFEQTRAELSQDFVSQLDSRLDGGNFELLMPEWETTTSVNLMPWLTEIGAAPGLYPGIGPDTFLSAGLHGADIAVDDVGTVAAAATALGFSRSLPVQPAVTIAADRPFFYLIRHVDTGLVLFTGQVTDPG